MHDTTKQENEGKKSGAKRRWENVKVRQEAFGRKSWGRKEGEREGRRAKMTGRKTHESQRATTT